jgi:hypothetical protein
MKLNLFLIAIGVVLVTGSAGGATSLPPEAGLSDLLTLAAFALMGFTFTYAGVSFIKDSE